MGKDWIKIVGARQHNLKNLTLSIPRNKLVVITGLSGSGKSSLAFDTLFAEGQRKYVESLSAYARQFLDQLQKPEVDYIEGLSPTIAIEQRSSGTNPRSIIATTTEIYDYLRLLYAQAGQPHCPISGQPISRETTSEIIERMMSFPARTRLILLAPVIREQKGEFRDVLERLSREGFVRARVDGEMIELGANARLRLDPKKAHTIEVVVDRLVIEDKIRVRLGDSVETALQWGEGRILALIQTAGDTESNWVEHSFSNRYYSPATGQLYDPPTPKHFSFNSPHGACPVCHGLGQKLVLDWDRIVPDRSKSLEGGAIVPWRRGGKRMIVYYKSLLKALTAHYQQSLEVPYEALSEDFKKVLKHGSREEEIEFQFWRAGKSSKVKRPFEGVIPNLERLYQETESEFTRNRLKTFMGQQRCDACQGARIKPEILAVTLKSQYEGSNRSASSESLAGKADIQACCAEGLPDGPPRVQESASHHPDAMQVRKPATQQTGKSALQSGNGGASIPGLSIMDVCRLSISEAVQFFADLCLTDFQRKVVSEVVLEIQKRLKFLENVGLGYLTLDRESGTLSGGEAQRIRLATQIGAGLVGVLYILDEPSIGLHQRDNERLLRTLEGLRDLDNSVLVVEHDEDTIRRADYIIDLGPGAGIQGGEVVAAGVLKEILTNPRSLTGKYLSNELSIAVPRKRFKPSTDKGWLTVLGASQNNLKNIDVRIPLGALTCVTGVSGSGKSTLVDDTLRPALFKHLHGSTERPGTHKAILGLQKLDKTVVIDQTPIGRTPRSNPATYTGIFVHIRDLFSKLPAAKIRGYDAGRFSFNVKGGRCEKCQGDGVLKIEMHFLPPVYVPCELCNGKRYNRQTLEITYKGKNIADVLAMTVDEAVNFFRAVPAIYEVCLTLAEVGLGYIGLGQSATTLSGGEAQRLKLAAELSRKSTGQTLYILDEPTTGLHFHDVAKLLEVLFRLRAAGNTLIIIEHNLDIIKNADWIIDLGPDGGTGGGRVVAEGTPEEVAQCPGSYTGQFLQRILS